MDYPPAWGVERIKDDLRKKLAEEDDRDRKWAVTVLPERKAFCGPLNKSNTPFDKQSDDCIKLMFTGVGEPVVPTDWENQFQELPIPAFELGLVVAPWAFGPPLLLLIIGRSLEWIAMGFRRI